MVIDNKTQQQIFSLYNIVDYNLFLSITFDLDFYSHIVPQILTLMFEIIFFFFAGKSRNRTQSLKISFNKIMFF